MKIRVGAALAALAAILTVAQDARGQMFTLRVKYEPGQVKVYERSVRTETFSQAGQQSRKTATDIIVRHQATVLEVLPDPTGAKIFILETPGPERLVGYEEGGKDLLSKIAEQSRSRPLNPAWGTQYRDSHGDTTAWHMKVSEPNAALESVLGETRALPSDPIKIGDTWTRELDLGIAKAVIATKCTGQRVEGTTPCAVLETTATVTFTGDLAQRVSVEKVEAQTAVATDGSGILSHSGTAVISEKRRDGETRISRTFQEKLVQASRLEGAQLEKVKADATIIEKALKQAADDDLDGALAAFQAFIKANPQSSWQLAVQNMHDTVLLRRLMTKPVTPNQLRLMLQQLQTDRNRVAAQNDIPQLEQIDRTLRQIVGVNAKALLEETANPDVIARDLAVFGLAFLQEPKAAERLTAMAKDDSSQVRGTAVIGLAIQGKAVEPAMLKALLADAEPRVRGAAALLARRTVKRDDPQAAAFLPQLAENLKVTLPWTRMNSAVALAELAPAGSPLAAAALIAAYKAETEQALKTDYLRILKVVTGVDASDVVPYETWAKEHPAPEGPAAGVSPAPPEKTPGQPPVGTAQTPAMPLAPPKPLPLPPSTPAPKTPPPTVAMPPSAKLPQPSVPKMPPLGPTKTTPGETPATPEKTETTETVEKPAPTEPVTLKVEGGAGGQPVKIYYPAEEVAAMMGVKAPPTGYWTTEVYFQVVRSKTDPGPEGATTGDTNKLPIRAASPNTFSTWEPGWYTITIMWRKQGEKDARTLSRPAVVQVK